MCTHPPKPKIPIWELTLFAMLGALTFGAKVVMAPLPNIEPVSLMVMLFAVSFGWKGLYPMYLYVLMEVLYFGLGFWNFNYLYAWLILFLGAMAIRRLKHPLWWAILSGMFGLAFGLLCAPVYAIAFGSWRYGLVWWLKGLEFDIPHAIGNFVIALTLFAPLRKLLEKLCAKLRR